MKIFNPILLMSLFVASPLQAIEQSIKMAQALPQACIQELKPHLAAINMSLEDLDNKAKTIQFRQTYINTPTWEKIKAACAPSSIALRGCDCVNYCNNCGYKGPNCYDWFSCCMYCPSCCGE